jgi:hypothetical protein
VLADGESLKGIIPVQIDYERPFVCEQALRISTRPHQLRPTASSGPTPGCMRDRKWRTMRLTTSESRMMTPSSRLTASALSVELALPSRAIRSSAATSLACRAARMSQSRDAGFRAKPRRAARPQMTSRKCLLSSLKQTAYSKPRRQGTLHYVANPGSHASKLRSDYFPDRYSRRMVGIRADRPLRRRSPPAPDPQIMNLKILFKSV